MARGSYGEARGKEAPCLERRRTQRQCFPSTTPVADGRHLFPLSRQRMLNHCASDELLPLSLALLFLPHCFLVSSHMLR